MMRGAFLVVALLLVVGAHAAAEKTPVREADESEVPLQYEVRLPAFLFSSCLSCHD
jgi:hypothetical protein